VPPREKVRFDAGHKLDQHVVGTLGRYETPRLVTVKSGVNHTEAMLAWARHRVEALRGLDLDGYILLLRHYIGKFRLDYLRDQVYPDPHPRELMLLNHV
jgi:hypothetical protein